jgi:hypothetical protein
MAAAASVSFAYLFVTFPLAAASPAPKPQVIKSIGFAISKPVRSLPPARPDPKETRPPIWERENELRPKPQSNRGDIDGALQSSAALLAMPTPIVSFEGGSVADDFAAFGFRLSPPDTNGAVGPDHYVQMVNLLTRVFDKTGTPLTPFFKVSSVFTPLGGLCSTTDDGDPVVVYDAMADRWILSQFGFTSITAPPYHECVAISQTADPTGSYFLYDFITVGNNFPDYPKLSVWPDAYYMTVHQFLNGGPFNGSGAYALERQKMITGDPTASLIYFNLDLNSHPEGIFGILSSGLDGLTPPPVGTPATFIYPTADEFGDPGDALRLFDFHVDFSVPGNSTFTERAESPLAVAAWDPRDSGTRRDVEQPPPATSANAVDAISGQLMFRLPARMISGELSYTLNVTVNVGGVTPMDAATFQAGIRWIQLHRNLATGTFSIADQGTYAPTAPNPVSGENRWMGSIAQDNQGNIALGFSLSSLTNFPSIHYAGRLTTDPPGTLGQGEATLIDGTGVQRSTTNRWGDYSSMTIDPADDCTFWFTEEYYTLAGQVSSTVGWQTRVGSFKYPSCAAAPSGTLSGTITACASGLPLAGALVSVEGGFARTTDGSGTYSMGLPPGTYNVTVSAPGYTPATSMVTITNGVPTTLDVCLPTSSPVATPAALAVDAHTGTGTLSNLNHLLEPGESKVVIEPSWHNGLAGAVALTGTASNLIGPGGALYSIDDGSADYGTVAPGGTNGCYGATGNCYQMSVMDPGPRPVLHWDATFDELTSDGATKTWTLHLGKSFTDVSTDIVADPYYSFIETIFHNSVTAGCQDGTVFCPTDPTTRAQMAVFLLKGFLGSTYVPPACASIFSDVPCPATPQFPFSDWIEDLSGRGITAGCQAPGDPLAYCPDNDVLRQEMAVFLLKTSQGPGYTPPACASIFSDVPCPATQQFPYSDFIEDIYNRGITAGCQAPGDPLAYCPGAAILRQQMAVFVTKTFGLVLYGP